MATNDAVLFSVRVHRHFHACATHVFDAFLQPAVASHFLFATPAGHMVVAEVDARIGGHFNFTDLRADGEVAHTGIYAELDRPHRLAFTLSVKKYSDATDRITIDIMPRGGGCDLTLTHQMSAQMKEFGERARQGWSGILEGLATAISRPPPAPPADPPGTAPTPAFRAAQSPAPAQKTSR